MSEIGFSPEVLAKMQEAAKKHEQKSPTTVRYVFTLAELLKFQELSEWIGVVRKVGIDDALELMNEERDGMIRDATNVYLEE